MSNRSAVAVADIPKAVLDRKTVAGLHDLGWSDELIQTFDQSEVDSILRMQQKPTLFRTSSDNFTTSPLDEFSVPFYPKGTINWSYEGGIDGLGNAFGYYSPTTRSAKIDMIRVDPNRKRQGIGRKALGVLEEFLRSLGATTVRGHAKEGSEPFWVAMGYTVGNKRKGHLPVISKRIAEKRPPVRQKYATTAKASKSVRGRVTDTRIVRTR